MAALLESGVTCIIKAKSIERVIAPIAAQVCHLIIISEWGDSDGKFANLEEEAEEVAKVTKQLALVASRLAEESEDDILRKEMGPARELVVISGNNMLLAAQKLCIQPQYPQHREELIASAQDVLMGTLKILLIEDDALVRRIVTAAHWLLDCITLLESAKDVSSLLKSFQGFSEALLLLNCLVKSRIQELRDNSQQEFLDHSLKTLKNCISMLYTALLTSLKHPQNEQTRSAKKYITDQMDTTITNIISLLRSDSNEMPQANAGSYSHKLHSLFQLLSRSTCSIIKDSDFDSLVRDLVFHSMAVANASREKKQLKVVKHCQRLLQLRSKISGQAKLLENHAKHMQQDLEESCASMKKELQNLDSSMVTTILYHILDSFTQTKEPLQELVKAAEQSSNIHGVNQLDQLQPFLPAFLMHADRMIQVAGFVSASASNIKSIQAIESSMKCLKRLKDNVVPILLDLNKNSHRSTALERLAVLCQQWESETQQLLGALDDVVNIYEFTDLSIEEIVDDKAKCEKAFKAQSAEHFYEHTSNLIGHVNIIVQAAKRHVDKSDDPIFRNGLLVLVKQVESAIPPVSLAVHQCSKSLSDVKSLVTFSERILKMIKLIHILRDGLNGFNHPDILSPLREQARQLVSSKVAIYTEDPDFSILDVKNKIYNPDDDDSVKLLEKNVVKPQLLCSIKTNIHNKPLPIINKVNTDTTAQSLDLLPVLYEVLSATKKKDITSLNVACTNLLELSNCYAQAAKEATAITDEAETEKLESLRSGVVTLTPDLIRSAQEIAINPTLRKDSLYKHAALFSNRITEIKQILLPAVGSWYHAVHSMTQNESEDSITQTLHSIGEITRAFSDMVQLAANSKFSNTKSTVSAVAQESIAILHTKLKRVQTNAKHLYEVVISLPLGSANLEGPCILWSMSVQVLLNSVDKLLGSNTFVTQGKVLKHEFAHQKCLSTFSENSLRIQQAATLSALCCIDKNTNRTIIDLKGEITDLTETFLQSAELLNTSPLPSINLLARSELLQRELQIKVKMLAGIIGRVNADYEDAVKNTVHLAILTATNHRDKKIASHGNFEKQAASLLANVNFVQENIQSSLYYIRDQRLEDNLSLITEHLCLLTSEIVSKARKITENLDLDDVSRLEILTKDWSAKAHYIVTQLQKVKEINGEVKNLITQGLQSRFFIGSQNTPVEKTVLQSGQPKCKATALSFKKKMDPVHLEKEQPSVNADVIHQHPVTKWDTVKDCNAPQNVFCNSSSAYTLAEAALFLKRETDKWEDEKNQIVQVTKEMATQMYNMAQFLKKKGPIKTKEEFIISAKQIAVNGQVITNFAHIIAEYCLDRRCATELLCAAEQILTLTNQLNIISSVKAATPGSKSSDEILVKNAQNLMQIVLKSIKAAETACIKGLRQPPPNTDEAQAAALCIQWKKMLQRHRVREALNPEMDDLGLRKTRLSQATPSLAPVIKIPDSQLKYQ
ncbi:hypothetical protein AOXY_G6628 [Acipenser oxyrinchus oxyrinchus]|uniref:Catenin alpha-1 n=1 Tax=Acipenser oxyrinchus oxyrinchus TaxID=40147 RepID=A0AAD8GCL9_ACIOX|nr:hypothetical protein AOXY_G6628 [Acipenser oxyrinchus oxyrinchus]